MNVRIDSAAPSLTTTPEAGAAPPRRPDLPVPRALHYVAGLSGTERSAAHAANLALRRRDLEDFRRYVEAFVAEHARCRTLAESDAFGGVSGPASGSSRFGMTGAELADHALLDQEGLRVTRDGALAVVGHRDRLRGEKAPLSVDANASVTAYVSAGSGRRYGVSAGASTDGPITTDAFVGSQRHRATIGGTPGAPVPPTREYALGPVTITCRDGHRDRIELDPMPLSPFGLTVATDRQSVTLCGRAGKTFKKGDDDRAVTLEAKVCGTVHLTTPRTFEPGVGAMLRRPAAVGEE